MQDKIARDFSLPEEDDWNLNVQPRLSGTLGSVEIRNPDGQLVAWRIKEKYE